MKKESKIKNKMGFMKGSRGTAKSKALDKAKRHFHPDSDDYKYRRGDELKRQKD